LILERIYEENDWRLLEPKEILDVENDVEVYQDVNNDEFVLVSQNEVRENLEGDEERKVKPTNQGEEEDMKDVHNNVTTKKTPRIEKKNIKRQRRL
jgi:hypothetical protein